MSGWVGLRKSLPCKDFKSVGNNWTFPNLKMNCCYEPTLVCNLMISATNLAVLLSILYYHTISYIKNSHTLCKEKNTGVHWLNRCTFSYPNWVFVFMGSVNYISRWHGSFLNCVTCHDLYWEHWWETMPWMPFIWSNWFPVFAHLEPKSWYQQSPSHLLWNHLHLLNWPYCTAPDEAKKHKIC